MSRTVGNELKIHVCVNSSYKIRTEQHQGRSHWVVPVVMMVEGVHNGSRGPLLYTAEELRRFTSAWDGIPVVINHPEDEDGTNISAGNPDTMENGLVGRIYNTHFDDKLRAEVWIDIENLREISQEAFDHIQNQQSLEVSVGVFCDEDPTSGEWNEEHYDAIARNYRPDHLALLPNAVGACSWDDGCGIRTNKNNKGTKQEGGLMNKKDKEFTKELFHNATPFHDGLTIVDNETGFREIERSIQAKLDAMDDGSRVHYLEEVYDDYFVYGVVNRGSGGERAFYKRGYEVENDGTLDFKDDAVQVKKNVTFEAVENTEDDKTKFSNNKKKKRMERVPKTTCKIEALIKNEATHFTKDDQEWLESLEEDVLDKLLPKEVKAVEPIVDDEAAKVEAAKIKAKDDAEKLAIANQGNGKPAEVTEEQIKNILSKHKDPAAFIDNFMPDGLKGQMKSGIKMYQEKRAQLIEVCIANSEFTKEQLESWSDENLQSLHNSVVPETDYSIFDNAPPQDNEGELEEEMDSMLVINKTPEKEKEGK